MKKLLLLIVSLMMLVSLSQGHADAACGARFVPERDDDFAWENDRVAFRVYGPALRGKGVNSGIDCWLKRVETPIIDKWYAAHLKGVSYHQDHGEGYDPYHVGSSRGCGGLGLWVDGAIIPSETFSNWKVLEVSDEFVTFVLSYKWSYAGDQYTEEKEISIQLGDQLFNAQSTFRKNGELAVGLPIAVGLTTHDGNARASSDVEFGWMACWETIDGSALGTAVLMDPKRITGYELLESTVKDASHALFITESDAHGQVHYSAGFGWERAGVYRTQADWINYLIGQAATRSNSGR